MLLRVPSPQGSIDVEADEKAAPVACRCLQYQILKRAWDRSEIRYEPGGVRLVNSSFTPMLGAERPRALVKGDVAFGESTNELLFWTGSDHGPIKTVIGKFKRELEAPEPTRTLRSYD